MRKQYRIRLPQRFDVLHRQPQQQQQHSAVANELMNNKMACKNKVCLIVIDGWGISDNQHGNAIANAETPVMDSLAKNGDQFVTLDASGLAVGLPAGLMGNSEVGHLNIGAGRVIYQDIVRINLDVAKKVIIATRFNLIMICFFFCAEDRCECQFC